jgi:hypothetical protein
VLGRRITGTGVLLLLAAVAGCGGSSGASPPATLPPAPTPPLLATAPSQPSAPPGNVPSATVSAVSPTARQTTAPANAPTVEAVANGFSTALIRDDTRGALSYLSAALQVQAASQGLTHLLGLTQLPTGFQYAVTNSDPSRAAMTLVYQYPGASINEVTTLVHTPAGWQISAIHPG